MCYVCTAASCPLLPAWSGPKTAVNGGASQSFPLPTCLLDRWQYYSMLLDAVVLRQARPSYTTVITHPLVQGIMLSIATFPGATRPQESAYTTSYRERLGRV